MIKNYFEILIYSLRLLLVIKLVIPISNKFFSFLNYYSSLRTFKIKGLEKTYLFETKMKHSA